MSGEMSDKASSASWMSSGVGIGIWGGYPAMKTYLECPVAECVLDSIVVVVPKISIESRSLLFAVRVLPS